MSTETNVVEFKNELPTKVPQYLKEIEELKSKYGTLTLTDLNDKKQLALIATGRKEFKAARVGVEKFMKGVRDGANAFSKSVIAKEKEIVALIEPEEARLQAEEDKYNAEQERLAEIKRKEEEETFNSRVNYLTKNKFQLVDSNYTLHDCGISLTEVRVMDERMWKNLVDGEIHRAWIKQIGIEKEEERLEEERIAEENRLREEKERLKREELLRLETQRKEQEVREAEQRKRQAEIEAKELEIKKREEELALQEREKIEAEQREQERIEAENRRVVDEERRKKEIEAAEKAAAERERQRIVKEAELAEAKRIENERKAAEKLAKQPDKKKLQAAAHEVLLFATKFNAIELKSEEANEIRMKAHELLQSVKDYINKESENL